MVQSVMASVDEDISAPNEAWFWAYGCEPVRNFGSRATGLRELGYVLWDGLRLASSGQSLTFEGQILTSYDFRPNAVHYDHIKKQELKSRLLSVEERYTGISYFD